jgi:ATP-binding cassette subfamily F protein 3
MSSRLVLIQYTPIASELLCLVRFVGLVGGLSSRSSPGRIRVMGGSSSRDGRTVWSNSSLMVLSTGVDSTTGGAGFSRLIPKKPATARTATADVNNIAFVCDFCMISSLSGRQGPVVWTRDHEICSRKIRKNGRHCESADGHYHALVGSIILQSVHKEFGPKTVLSDVTVEVRTGETIGLVGANGSGKTTLFRIMTGELTPDQGSVQRTKGLTYGYLTQTPRIDENRTVIEEVRTAFDHLFALERQIGDLSNRIADAHGGPDSGKLMADYDRLNEEFDVLGGFEISARLEEVLSGLGFSKSDRDLPVRVLSGGQKGRLALAKLLLHTGELLLLDEPTNHLDIDATMWLERFLAKHRGGAVVISHDRYLLDRIAQKIIEVDRYQTKTFPGNYSNYALVKANRTLEQQRQFDKDRAFVEKEQAFIDKHISGQRTAEAKGRRKRLERRMADGEFVTNTAPKVKSTALSFQSAGRTGHVIIEFREASKAYDNRKLFSDVHLDVNSGDRLGIIGPNGVGKTTLLKACMGLVPLDRGHANMIGRFDTAYYDQELTGLNRELPILDEIRTVRPDEKDEKLRGYLGRFLFSGDDVFRPIRLLSGGEQSRVMLAKLILMGPDVLILDEPTNHLDIPSREVLEEALLEFNGTIVFVSHDRYFIDRMATRLLVLEPGWHRLLIGNYTDYAKALEAEEEKAAAVAEKSKPAPAKQKQKPDSVPQQRKSSKYDSLSLEEIEERLMTTETLIEKMQEQFGNPKYAKDVEAARELQENFDELNEELAELDEVWQQRVEEHTGG